MSDSFCKVDVTESGVVISNPGAMPFREFALLLASAFLSEDACAALVAEIDREEGRPSLAGLLDEPQGNA